MRTIEVKLYQFNELDDKAKEKARQWWRECDSGDNYWSECTIEEAVREGEFMGIEFNLRDVGLMGGGVRQEPCIFWSGFWNQGDGSCFEGTWRASNCHPEKVADGWGADPSTTEIKRIANEFGRLAKKYPHAYFVVKHSGRYSHKYCTEFDFDLDGVEGSESSIKEIEWDEACEELKENARDFMDWIYRQLEKQYEWHNSDEQVDETITANDYEFTEEGKPA